MKPIWLYEYINNKREKNWFNPLPKDIIKIRCKEYLVFSKLFNGKETIDSIMIDSSFEKIEQECLKW